MIVVLCTKNDKEGTIIHHLDKGHKKRLKEYMHSEDFTLLECFKDDLLSLESCVSEDFEHNHDIRLIDDAFLRSLSIGPLYRILLDLISDAKQ